jgi:hypothetical protein
MKPHELNTFISAFMQRVINEKEALDGNIKRLGAFLESDTFTGLPESEQADMRIQLGQMQQYSDTLQRRIDRYVPADAE